MSWFRKKGKYWYFVERINEKEIQHYIGDDKAVIKKLILTEKKPCKNLKGCQVDPTYCPYRNPKVHPSAACQYYEIEKNLLPKLKSKGHS